MSQLTCIACTLPIYKGQRAISLEFGQVEQSQKSHRDIIKGYATDIIHFGCIGDYLGRIDGELYSSIMDHHKQTIRKQVITEYREELKQEIYDEIVDEVGRTCAVCQAEIDDAEIEDSDPVVKCAVVQGVQTPPLPPSPFSIPPLPMFNGYSK